MHTGQHSYANYRRETVQEFQIVGQSVAITRSQRQNAVICSQFWRSFNKALAALPNRKRGAWQKFAITYPGEDSYRYFCGIPLMDDTEVPCDFELMTIAAGSYIVFEHVGPMGALAATLSTIYRQVLPDLALQPSRGSLFHFESYDRRFHWTRPDSVIEVWLPVTECQR